MTTPDTSSPETAAHLNRHRTYRSFWLVMILIFFSLFAEAIHLHRKRGAASEVNAAAIAPVTVTPATARTGDIGVYINAIGTVTPVYTDSITSQVTGVIKSVNYREGQVVRKGDPLIQIDPQPYEAQLAEAKGVLERDRNLLDQAQMDLERFRQAWSGNAIARQQFEDQEKIVLQDQGTVKSDEGAVQYAQVQVDYCHITAPIEGRAGLRLVDPGNLVTANGTTSLVVITQVHPITVIFTLPEDSLSSVLTQISQGKQLIVQAFDRAQDKLLATGKLSSIDNQIDTTTGTVKLRAIFENSSNLLFPNQFVNARLLVTTLRGQVLIPSSAIQHNSDSAFVYLVRGGKVQLRLIKPSVSEGEETAVEGVQAGDIVANSTFERLEDGAQVALTRTSESGSLAAPRVEEVQ